jgi:hypothetical protein
VRITGSHWYTEIHPFWLLPTFFPDETGYTYSLTNSFLPSSLSVPSSLLPFLPPSGTSGWTRGLMLAKQLLYHLSHSPSPVCIANFWDRILLFAWLAWTANCLFVLLSAPGMTGTHHCAQPLVEMGVLLTFCLGWPQTLILLIFAFQVARNTGFSHCAWASLFLFKLQIILVILLRYHFFLCFWFPLNGVSWNYLIWCFFSSLFSPLRQVISLSGYLFTEVSFLELVFVSTFYCLCEENMLETEQPQLWGK